jgi:putative phosphoserine phosphatase/1-acylglycerol-3-phosphate O-acyltransferase
MPKVLNLTDPPTVRIRVGEPVDLKGKSVDADTKRIMKAIMAELPDEAREPKMPTADELALTYPPGYLSNPTDKSARRPGAD